jgi:hypothetical protein
VALVRATSPGLTIYTNGDDVVRLLTGRRVASLPLKWDPVSRRTNGQYGLEVDAVVQEVARGRALVVYFDRIDWRGYLPSPEELEGKGLAGGRRVRDAVVYGADK